MNEDKSNLTKYAMQYGLFFGLYWILSFLITTISIKSQILHVVTSFITFSIPVVGYFFVKNYRNKICGGYIGFNHAWTFGILLYFFAALIAALANYIFFEFINPNYLMDQVTFLESLLKDSATWEQTEMFQKLRDMLELQIQGMKKTIEEQGVPSAIEMTIQSIWSSVYSGFFFSMIIALIVKKKNPYTTPSI